MLFATYYTHVHVGTTQSNVVLLTLKYHEYHSKVVIIKWIGTFIQAMKSISALNQLIIFSKKLNNSNCALKVKKYFFELMTNAYYYLPTYNKYILLKFYFPIQLKKEWDDKNTVQRSGKYCYK